MHEGKYLKRDELLELPVSITSWIVLRDYASCHADMDIYKKIISDYRKDCPLFELEKIFLTAKASFDEKEFQELVEFLFNQHHMCRSSTSNADGLVVK